MNILIKLRGFQVYSTFYHYFVYNNTILYIDYYQIVIYIRIEETLLYILICITYYNTGFYEFLK